jgi:tRNA threonylcarbamoyladenosine biosynthesis protein TsaE
MTTAGKLELVVDSEQAMEALGGALAQLVGKIRIITLTGDLGVGKTTLVRGLLRALGYPGAVKSPTFTLIEPYTLGDQDIYHFDLYRLEDAEELEFLGAREYLEGGDLCLIEWPEKGAGFLPQADVNVTINKVNNRRNVEIELRTDRGGAITDEVRRLLGAFA